MNLPETFKSISERIQRSATVKTVYGEPITAEGKTIISVARVRYGFGAGGGTGEGPPHDEGDADLDEEGPSPTILGSGGGIEVSPIGVIEITSGETRFISFEERRTMIRASALVLLVGMFLWRRRRRS